MGIDGATFSHASLEGVGLLKVVFSEKNRLDQQADQT